MKTKLIAAILTLSGLCVFAQPAVDLSETRPRNDVSINLMGDASILSVNYERLLVVSPNFLLAGKFGLGFNKEDLFTFCLSPPCELSPIKTYFTLPHHLTANMGGNKKFMEIGIGGTIYGGGYVLYGTGGFRIQPLESEKLVFRIFLQRRIFQASSSDIIFIPFGLSLGVAL